MIYKDNTNPTQEDYYYFTDGNYWMVERSRAKYIALFEELGFKIIQEKIIDTDTKKIANTQRIGESYMCILQKE